MRDVRPLNARSLVLSVLLGLPDATLTNAELTRLATHFGIAAGTVRTALSRMTAAGEVTPTGNGYRLVGRLLSRKAAQDTGRAAPPAEWDGSWWIVAVTATNRALADRRDFRTRMVNARMGELRPDTWMRPANVSGPDLAGGAGDGDTVVIRGAMAGTEPAALVARLWPLDELAERCRELIDRLTDGAARLARDGTGELRTGLLLAADVVRFLREEPYLPPRLTPADWRVDDLRRAYLSYDAAFGRTLRAAISPAAR